MPQLDRHDEEEHREQPVGHPVLDREVEDGAGDRDMEVEDCGERIVRREVRQQDAQSCRDEQEDSGELLTTEGVRGDAHRPHGSCGCLARLTSSCVQSTAPSRDTLER